MPPLAGMGKAMGTVGSVGEEDQEFSLGHDIFETSTRHRNGDIECIKVPFSLYPRQHMFSGLFDDSHSNICVR